MAQTRKKSEALLQDLIIRARKRHIEVRTEKLLREVGYRARSGRCRLRGQDLIIMDREMAVADQVELLAAELAKADALAG